MTGQKAVRFVHSSEQLSIEISEISVDSFDDRIEDGMRLLTENNISEEPDVGNPQVSFCEGHASPYTKF